APSPPPSPTPPTPSPSPPTSSLTPPATHSPNPTPTPPSTNASAGTKPKCSTPTSDSTKCSTTPTNNSATPTSGTPKSYSASTTNASSTNPPPPLIQDELLHSLDAILHLRVPPHLHATYYDLPHHSRRPPRHSLDFDPPLHRELSNWKRMLQHHLSDPALKAANPWTLLKLAELQEKLPPS
ncbi:uncharacterized protein LOC126316691, partial [Schistocerca gregaria]|uniref:uncharacterized protein LOC126316691 n=1 Tax=Schistocerca gregaria TaxID=7010 RepID=UPI00211ED266